MLNTEAPDTRHPQLDCYATPELVNALIDDQLFAVQAVRAVSTGLAEAVEAAAERLARGGRLIYVGAGTSGRLGVLDSVELLPTFSWPPERALALIAGGDKAMYRAVEGAEDDSAQGSADLTQLRPAPGDVVILLAASGATPYVMGALQTARAAGALTIAFANNPDAPLTRAAEIGITLDTGSEVISGSTRLKAGTSQKIALNTLSSAIMVRLNKIHSNLMVDLQPTNAKLYRRAIRLVVLATGCPDEAAQTALESCRYRVKTAIVMVDRVIDAVEAERLLAITDGSVRRALVANV